MDVGNREHKTLSRNGCAPAACDPDSKRNMTPD
jgi:hypothetical protein